MALKIRDFLVVLGLSLFRSGKYELMAGLTFSLINVEKVFNQDSYLKPSGWKKVTWF